MSSLINIYVTTSGYADSCSNRNVIEAIKGMDEYGNSYVVAKHTISTVNSFMAYLLNNRVSLLVVIPAKDSFKTLNVFSGNTVKLSKYQYNQVLSAALLNIPIYVAVSKQEETRLLPVHPYSDAFRNNSFTLLSGQSFTLLSNESIPGIQYINMYEFSKINLGHILSMYRDNSPLWFPKEVSLNSPVWKDIFRYDQFEDALKESMKNHASSKDQNYITTASKPDVFQITLPEITIRKSRIDI